MKPPPLLLFGEGAACLRWAMCLLLNLHFFPIFMAICLCYMNFDFTRCTPTTITTTATTIVNKSNDPFDLFKYEEIPHSNGDHNEITATTTTTSPSIDALGTYTDKTISSRSNEHQSNSELYTLQLGQHISQRQQRHEEHIELNYEHRCPKHHIIHPCDCLELDKRVEEGALEEGSGELPDASSDTTPTVEMIEVESSVSPDHIETVVFCKNIRSVQVLTEAIRGFQGHRVNYFVLDGCKLPPFPNNLFRGIHVVWMEILNSTMQFHDSFFHHKSCP